MSELLDQFINYEYVNYQANSIFMFEYVDSKIKTYKNIHNIE